MKASRISRRALLRTSAGAGLAALARTPVAAAATGPIEKTKLVAAIPVDAAKGYDKWTYEAFGLLFAGLKDWNLDKFARTSLRGLKKRKSILLAWTSKLSGEPVIVGAWRIDGSRAKKYRRYSFPATDDVDLRKKMLGLRLSETGKHWQGPNIFPPTPSRS